MLLLRPKRSGSVIFKGFSPRVLAPRSKVGPMRKPLIASGVSLLLLSLTGTLASTVPVRPALGFVSAERADGATHRSS